MVAQVGHGYCPACRSGQRNGGTGSAGRIRTRGMYLTCLPGSEAPLAFVRQAGLLAYGYERDSGNLPAAIAAVA
jgi:hypothetical protein